MLFQSHFSRIRPSTKRFSSFFDFLAYTYIIRLLPNFPRFFPLPQGKERTFRPTRGDLFLTLPPPPPSNLPRTLFVHADTDSKFDTWRNSSLSLFSFLSFANYFRGNWKLVFSSLESIQRSTLQSIEGRGRVSSSRSTFSFFFASYLSIFPPSFDRILDHRVKS